MLFRVFVLTYLKMYMRHELKLKADILFWTFEKYYFQNVGNYPRKTNLVLEFAEFIEQAEQEDLEQYVSFSSPQEFEELKHIISQGVDAWLDAGDIKTMLIT